MVSIEFECRCHVEFADRAQLRDSLVIELLHPIVNLGGSEAIGKSLVDLRIAFEESVLLGDKKSEILIVAEEGVAIFSTGR